MIGGPVKSTEEEKELEAKPELETIDEPEVKEELDVDFQQIIGDLQQEIEKRDSERMDMERRHQEELSAIKSAIRKAVYKE